MTADPACLPLAANSALKLQLITDDCLPCFPAAAGEEQRGCE